MRAPGFWQTGGPLAALTAPLGWIYGHFSGARMARPPRFRPPVPVIAIGNLTAGGAGKTPTAIAIAAILRRAGHAPAFVTRGYGGTAVGPHQVDPARDSSADVGDEPLLLAAHAPTIVARDRAAGTDLAARLGADVVIFDDGFQNPAVAKTLSLVVIDAGAGIGNGQVFPAGPLRAPLDAQLPRADGFVVIDDPGGRPLAPDLDRRIHATGRPVIAAAIVATAPETFSGKRVLAFAGIGRPDKFAGSLRQAGAEVVELAGFGDHHAFTTAEADELLRRAERLGCELATTAKDHVRLAAAHGPLAELARKALVLDIELRPRDAGALSRLVEAAAAKKTEGAAQP